MYVYVHMNIYVCMRVCACMFVCIHGYYNNKNNKINFIHSHA